MLHKNITILLIALVSYAPNSFSDTCGYVYDPVIGWTSESAIASGQAEPINEVPVPVTVITSQMIKDLGAKNLKEVLITYVPGITFVQDQNEVNIVKGGVYGSSQQKMLLLLNGHRLNSRSYSMASPDHSISLEKIDCIEVLRSPGSSLYGNVALTAVINIITKKGANLRGAEVSAGFGNHGQRKYSFLLGNDFERGKNDLLLWGTYYRSDGETVEVPIDEDFSRDRKDSQAILDGFRDKGSYDIGISYDFSNALGNFTFLAHQRYSNYIEPFSAGGLTGESYNYSDYSKFMGIGPGLGAKFSHLGLDYEKTFENNLGLKFQVYYDDNEIEAHLISDPSKKQHSFLGWYEHALGTIVQLSKPYQRWDQQGTWMIGIQGDRMEVYDSKLITGIDGQWGGISNYGRDVLDTGEEKIGSVFGQIKHRFNDQLIGNVGMRFDKKWRYKGEDFDELSPRLAFIYIPNNIFDVKVSYSEAFVDAPYWYRYNSLASYKGAQSLKPELMKSYQITPTFKVDEGKMIIGFNLFWSQFSDFIWRNNNPIGIYNSKTKEYEAEGQYQNGGSLEIRGIENETIYRGEGWNGTFNLTYQEAADSENYEAVDDKKMWNIPNWNANFVLNMNPFDVFDYYPESISTDLWVNFTARYIGEQLSPIDIRFDPYYEDGKQRPIKEGTPYYQSNKEVDDVWLFNAGFRWDNLWKGIFLDTRVYNLLDEKYYQGGSVTHPYPQPGRWFMITFGYQSDL